MGTGYYGGFGETYGSSKKQEKDTQEDLMDALRKTGTKFSEEDLVFITRDKSNQIIWLEKGNEFAGLKHIIERHSDDFFRKHNVDSKDIPNHLKAVLSFGNVEYNRLVNKNGKDGYERLYSYEGHYYLQTGIGTNGFVVSAYPIDEETAKKLIERYTK